MEALIPAINKLQDVFGTLGTEATIQLPEIVVVGVQSSGKSSVLESLVGRDFLPRGCGIVTRRPLVLQLNHVAKDDISCRSASEGTIGLKEWAKFLHTKDRIFKYFEDVKKMILKETSRVSGTNKAISPEPINLKIFSDRVVNLTLVDLPGLTKIPVGDQPDDIEEQVREMILHYISNPKSLILAVTPANTDLATSEALKLAREVDPQGFRTLAVITKLDLMDAGTNAVDVLCGRVIPVKLGIIGVVNRSQQDNVNKKCIEEALRDEIQFFQTKYPSLSNKNGIPFLAQTLNALLMNHIRECLPDLRHKINLLVDQFQSKLNSYGDAVDDKCKTLLLVITNFAVAYCSTIDGTSKYIETKELCGGARISYIFNETFGRTLDSIHPLGKLQPADILTVIRNAKGTRPAIYISEVPFELFIKRQIQKLRKPSLQCVDLVYDELQRIVHHCGADVQKDMTRFPKLYHQIMEVVTRLLKSRVAPAKQMVENIIAMELSYINSKHPDFVEASHMIMCSDFLENEGGKFKSGDGAMAKERGSRAESANWKGRITGSPPPRNPDDFQTTPKSVKSSSSLFGEAQGGQAVDPSTLKMRMTAREQRDCKVIEQLIVQYFGIVKKNVRHRVPKAIMHFLVNFAKDNLHRELVGQLYTRADYADLLDELDTISRSRQDTVRMLGALEKASAIISELRDPRMC